MRAELFVKTTFTAAMFLCCATLCADTVYLTSGVQVDGVIISESSDHVRLRIGNRESVFRSSEVLRVEKNEKTGGFDLEKLKAQAAEREKEMRERTGLTAEQRVQVSQFLGWMTSQNEDERIRGKNELIAMGKEADLFRYFEVWLPSMLPRFIPGVLEILAELNPRRARPLLLSQVEHPDALTRAAAIRLLGEIGDTGSADLIARGLVDPSEEVRVAAAYAFGALHLKEATPLLLAAWNDPELRVQKTCRESLKWIWSTQDNPVDFDNAADWEAFWISKAGSVSNKYDIAKLKPLVEPGTTFMDE